MSDSVCPLPTAQSPPSSQLPPYDSNSGGLNVSSFTSAGVDSKTDFPICKEFWFEGDGGDAYFLVESTLFCIHSSVLGRFCELFHDMWQGSTIPKPDQQSGLPQSNAVSKSNPIQMPSVGLKDFTAFLRFSDGSEDPTRRTKEDFLSIIKLSRFFRHAWGETYAKNCLAQDPLLSEPERMHVGRRYGYPEYIETAFKALAISNRLATMSSVEKAQIGPDMYASLLAVQSTIKSLKARRCAEAPLLISSHPHSDVQAKGGLCRGMPVWAQVWSTQVVPTFIDWPHVSFPAVPDIVKEMMFEIGPGGFPLLCCSCVEKTMDNEGQRWVAEQDELNSIINKACQAAIKEGYEVLDAANALHDMRV